MDGDVLCSAQKRRRVILRGDLSPDHVLHGPTGEVVTGIIDVGDPARNLVYVYEDCGGLPGPYARHVPPYDIRGLVRRMQRFLELGAAGWPVRCAAEEDADGVAKTEGGYLAALRARASEPPWSAALSMQGGVRA